MTNPRASTLALLIAALASSASAGAQSKTAHPAKRAVKTSATKVQPTVVKPTTVIVLPIDSAGGDSIRVIVQRDLDNGDRVMPAFIDPSIVAASARFGSDSINFELLKPSGASAVLRIKRTPTGVSVAAYDVGTGLVRQSGEFQVPVIGADRSQLIRDSLTKELDTRAAHSAGVLTSDAFVRDSLMKVSAAPPPKKKQNTKERLAARIAQAQRDSLVKEIDARRTAVLELAHRDTVERDSVLPLLLAADSAERDQETRAFRTAVHTVSDEIQRWLTGTPGIAATRIAYVQKSSLHVVDSDGAYDDVISTPGAALSPAWHPSGRAIVYADFNDAGTQIGEVNLDTHKARLISASNRGLNITPVFTPDGRNIVYASGGETPADLVMTDADGTTPARKLDFGKFENSSPSFSPDGSRMVFMSPRPALTPQLFTMNVDGTKIKQLTPSFKGKRSYRTGPDWSPTGEMVAYEQQNGDFQVWTITVATGKMKQLTSVAENEDPSWAPDGRHLAITSTRGGDRQIWVLDAVSGRFRQLTHSPGARLAAWSPTLHRDVAVAASGTVSGGNK